MIAPLLAAFVLFEMKAFIFSESFTARLRHETAAYTGERVRDYQFACRTSPLVTADLARTRAGASNTSH
jgi:hypothetical protein